MSSPPRGSAAVLNARINRALKVAADLSYVEGDHHKQYVIDQMVRALTGCELELLMKFNDDNALQYTYKTRGESNEYREFLEEYARDNDWAWDPGIAP
jgi:hypothetical protein